MAEQWNKSADWVPYTNLLGQIIYYLKSITSSEKSLMIMELMGVPSHDPGYIQTIEEIKRKTELLEIARWKLKRAFRRITETDKAAWKDKLPF